MLLPVDLRDWVPEDDLVHFVISAVEKLSLPSMKVNERGSGSRQYPPRVMLELLIYCYANGVFSSRQIERMTYRDLAVRYLTADTHPDHDTICSFRRNNAEVIGQAFVQLLELAREMGMVKVGTVSVDGTHIKANASKHKSVRYDRAGELERKLRKDVDRLLAQAEASDKDGGSDDQALPQEIARRERLMEKLAEAQRRLEKRAEEEAEEKAQSSDQDRGGPDSSGGGRRAKARVRADRQINLTDADSRLMRKSKRDSWQQAYNAQAVVDADGSHLILGADVITTPSDANQLRPAIESVAESVGAVERVLADGGYVNAEDFDILKDHVDLYVAMAAGEQNVRSYDFRPPKKRVRKKITDPRLLAMRAKLATKEGRRIYSKRASTVEPVFGTIKAAMNFRQFLLRGIEKVRIEWNLISLAYNIKRMWSLANT